jgi:hypothetical protein
LTEHDLTALCATLTTHQEAVDQCKLGLQLNRRGLRAWMKGLGRCRGYHKEAVGRHEDVVPWREKEVEEREKATSER